MRDTPHFGDVCLLGLGVTGQAVASYFLAHPDMLNSLTIYSGPPQQENLSYLRTLPESIIVRQDEELVSGSFDCAIVSPGIPPLSNLYQSALQAAEEVISEPELAWRISPKNWIGVTGTNGKTTVTELITALLRAGDKTAWAAGNIGTPCIEVVGKRKKGDWLVAELSSYQLHSTVRFAPDIALLLNITPDHLSWHGSHESYAADKRRILANLAPDKPAIIDVCLPQTRAIAEDLLAAGKRVIHVGSAQGLLLKSGLEAFEQEQALEVAYVQEETGVLTLELESGTLELLHVDELCIKGAHNISNALAAAAAAAEVGVCSKDINVGLAGFCPLAHRFEPCGEVAGVSFINDSKATNIDAAIRAVSAFADEEQQGKVVALFGGLDKGTNLDELVAACVIPCRYALCYGEAGERFFKAMDTQLAAVQVQDFDEAFARAFELAEPGDTILLSPACASFDEFDSFEARGDHFKECVSRLRSSVS